MSKEIPKVHRVKTDDLKVGAIIEKAEHPWASDRTAKKIARDHLQDNPNAYKSGGGGTEVTLTLNQNVKVKPAKPKKKVPPKQVDTGPSWIPNNLRFYG
jgi:hypothetical protein